MTMLEQAEVSIWQDLFTSIIEDADSNILLLDEEFRVVTLNPGFYWIFRETYGVELKRGTSILKSMSTVNPELARLWTARCISVMSGTTLRVEDSFEFEGRCYCWEITVNAKQVGDQQLLSVFGRDITIRKNFQKRMTEKEADLRSILDNIEDGIWMINENYDLLDFNKEFFNNYYKAFGVRLAKGKNILALIPAKYRILKSVWRERYEEGLKGCNNKYIDRYRVGDKLRTFEIKTYPIVENEAVIGLTVYARDITVQKTAEDTLKQQNDELSKINSELDRFVYSASHDLRAPLMSIKGLLNMIKAETDPNNQQQYLQLIDTSIDKLDKFITDIIHYSRNSRMDLALQEINFEELLNESIESLKYMKDAERVKSIRHFNIQVPFHSDHARLINIFNNIIANAVRYHDKWKESYIKIEVKTDKHRALLRFEDNGIGIAEEYQDKIFKMFFRASTESKGSGLGLYIVKSTVDRLGGRITVQSKLGEGTVFEIELPNRHKLPAR